MNTSDVNPELVAKEFIEHILSTLIPNSTSVEVTAQTDDLGILVSVKVSTEDMGKIIGKGGQTIQALRVLLRLLGGNHAKRMNLKIIEP